MFERNKLKIKNLKDKEGNPAGGTVDGPGLSVAWQDGPLGVPPKPATGAFVEDLLEAARLRLLFYQVACDGKFACRENALAATKIEEALLWLTARRMKRTKRKVQGTNNP